MRNKVFFILGGGGHTAQMILLQEKFPDEKYEKHFIVATGDTLSENRVKELGCYFIHKVDRYKETEDSLFIATIKNILLLRIVRQLLQSKNIVELMNKDILISAGPNTGIFVFIIAKLMGNFCVYVESWSRRKKLSKTGSLLKYFSNLFFVQWEDLRDENKHFIYKGRLL